jgi:hypothetical protein
MAESSTRPADQRSASATGAGSGPRMARRRALSVAATLGLLAGAVSACTSSSSGLPACPSNDATGCTSAIGSSAGASSDVDPGDAASTGPAAAPGDPADFAFPVAVSADHRYLVDQQDRPYLMVGDSPQCLSANLSTGQMESFFADRQAHGFNTAWVNLLCGPYTHGADDASTYDGIKPFTATGDVSTPNPAYFERMDTMVSLAAQHGITLLLDPAETGSFRDYLKDSGIDKTRTYGAFLGQRYQQAPNIIWMLGNDYQPEHWETYDPYEVALSEGIRSTDPDKLQTIELNYQVSTSFDDPTWPPLIDLATAYSYYPTYDVVLRAREGKPTQPVFMVEANYEFENNTGGPTTTDETLRRQEYWTMLSGATGQLYGNGYTWGLQDSSWPDHFDTPGVDQLGLMAKLFGERRWQDLVPDQQHAFLTGGYGTYGDQGDVLENDYATAALTADGELAMVYVPTSRTLEIDESKLADGVTSRWFDPVDGTFRPASAPFTTPGKNADGAEDWVLVFERPGG